MSVVRLACQGLRRRDGLGLLPVEVLEEVGGHVAGAEALVGEHGWWNGIVVFTPRPSIWNSESARCMRSIALARSGAQTISLAISES